MFDFAIVLWKLERKQKCLNCKPAFLRTPSLPTLVVKTNRISPWLLVYVSPMLLAVIKDSLWAQWGDNKFCAFILYNIWIKVKVNYGVGNHHRVCSICEVQYQSVENFVTLQLLGYCRTVYESKGNMYNFSREASS